MLAPPNPNQLMQTQRTLAFTPKEIYAAFADPTRLAAWWGPEGFSNTFELCEFAVNGNWRFIMHGPDGTNYPNESVFTELEANRKVVVRHTCMPYFTLSISLLPQDAGTLVVWQQVFDDAELAQNIRPIVEPCNEQNLDRLRLHLQGNLT
ncbi:MAG TPA: SRPBCC domain-containing protein [Cellvibrionaceae bacterium]